MPLTDFIPGTGILLEVKRLILNLFCIGVSVSISFWIRTVFHRGGERLFSDAGRAALHPDAEGPLPQRQVVTGMMVLLRGNVSRCSFYSTMRHLPNS